ncbi:MAG TPA: porin [Thermoanaerobaculia bacterium]|jgi:phosphate-selective porin|nr:porin [Thermoanaerobaculia bacterium]
MRYTIHAVLVLAIGLPALAGAQTLGEVKPAGKEPSLTIGGLLQVQFDAGDKGDSRFANDNDRFYLRRARLNASGRFLEEFDFRLEMDLSGTLANTTGLRAQMTDGYITWNRYSEANIRVGQFKTPFGFEQLYGDPRLFTIERTLVNDRLTLNRQLGIQVGGDFFEKRLGYAIGSFNGNGANNDFNDNNSLQTVGRVTAVPWQGNLGSAPAKWSVGANGFTSKDTALALSDLGLDSTPTTADKDGLFTGNRRGSGVDSQFVAGPFELWGELLREHFKPDSKIPRASFDSDGWYGQAAVYLVPDRFQIVVKYETFDPNDRKNADETNTATLGANIFFKGHDLKLMVNYLRTDLPGSQDKQDKVIARLQVIF